MIILPSIIFKYNIFVIYQFLMWTSSLHWDLIKPTKKEVYFFVSLTDNDFLHSSLYFMQVLIGNNKPIPLLLACYPFIFQNSSQCCLLVHINLRVWLFFCLLGPFTLQAHILLFLDMLCYLTIPQILPEVSVGTHLLFLVVGRKRFSTVLQHWHSTIIRLFLS